MAAPFSLSGYVYTVGATAVPPTNPPIRLSRYGLSTSAGAGVANLAAMQSAINRAITDKTWLINDLADGAYVFTDAGANPYEPGTSYSLTLGDGTTNFRLFGNRNAIFTLAADQQAGTTDHCYLFIGRNLKQCSISGGFDGGSLTQSGWTGGYSQGSGTIRIYQTSAGGGIQDLAFEDCYFKNSFGCPLNVGASADGRRVGGTVTFQNVRCERFGEGIQTENMKRARYWNCHLDDTAVTLVGDWFEPARCDWFEVIGCTTYGARSVSGSHVDCFGSYAGLIKDCVFQGGNDGIGTQSSSGTVKRVDLIDCTFIDLNTVSASCADRTHVYFKNPKVIGCGTVSSPTFQAGQANVGGTFEAGSLLEIDGGHIDGSYAVSVTRLGSLKIRNRTLITNAVDDAIICTKGATTDVPLIDLDVDVRNPVRYGLYVSGAGTSWGPKGSVRGVFAGAPNNRQIVAANVGHYENVVIDIESPDATPSTLNYGEAAGYKVLIDPDYDPGALPATSFMGSKGQRITIMGRAASRVTTATARWNLVTSPLTISATTTLEMEYVGSGVWREVRRVVGVAA